MNHNSCTWSLFLWSGTTWQVPWTTTLEYLISVLIGQEQPDQYHDPQHLYLISFLNQEQRWPVPWTTTLVPNLCSYWSITALPVPLTKTLVPNLCSFWSRTAWPVLRSTTLVHDLCSYWSGTACPSPWTITPYLIYFLIGQEQPEKHLKPQLLYLVFVCIGQEQHRTYIMNHNSFTN